MTLLTLFGGYVVIFDPWSLPERLHVYVVALLVVIAFDLGRRAGTRVLLWLKRTPTAAGSARATR